MMQFISCRCIDLHDVPVRIKQIDLRKPRKTLTNDKQPLGIIFIGILAKALGDQSVDKSLEIISSECEMHVGIVNCTIASKSSRGVLAAHLMS